MKAWEPSLPGSVEACSMGLLERGNPLRCSTKGRQFGRRIYALLENCLALEGVRLAPWRGGSIPALDYTTAFWCSVSPGGGRLRQFDCSYWPADRAGTGDRFGMLVATALRFYRACGLQEIRLRHSPGLPHFLPMPSGYPAVRGTQGDPWPGVTFEFVKAADLVWDLGYLQYRPGIVDSLEDGGSWHLCLCPWFERFLGQLIEAFEGRLPFSLSPIQIAVLPVDTGPAISDELKAHCDPLRRMDLRVEYSSGGPLRCRIAAAFSERIPVVLVIGDRERMAADFDVRVRSHGRLGRMGVAELLDVLRKLD